VSGNSLSSGWRLRSPTRFITRRARGSARCRSLSRKCSDACHRHAGRNYVPRFSNEKALSPNAGYCSSSRGQPCGRHVDLRPASQFGKDPDGARLDTIKRSPNYSGDGFQNLIPTPVLADDRSFVSELVAYLFAKKDRSVPNLPIPSVKTNLHSLDRNMDVVVWLGHSSYFIQLGGKRILIDPVFSASAGSAASDQAPCRDVRTAPESGYVAEAAHWRFGPLH
jgi:hypothetical protein